MAEEEKPQEVHPPAIQFNADLRKQVARDAQKVVAGRLSEAEFYQKHHQAYLKEFGVDHRLIDSDAGINRTPPESILEKGISRRTLFKVGGLSVAGLVLARWLGGSKVLGAEATAAGDNYGSLPLKEDSQPQPATRVQKGMVIDLENCDGCLNCVYACQHHNANSAGVFWLYVLAYKDENRDEPNFLVRPCQHCSNPVCVKVCPVRARHKREKDGLVLVNYNTCIGCRYCIVACPYGVNYFQWDEPKEDHYHEKVTDYRGWWVIGNQPKGTTSKCTFCPDRQDDGRNNTVCELACPHNVIHFGDLNDPNSRPNQYLMEKRKEKNGDISTFRLLENYGTKPSIIFIGQQPSPKAKAIEGPVSYADWGLVEERGTVLEGPKPWFMRVFGGKQ